MSLADDMGGISASNWNKTNPVGTVGTLRQWDGKVVKTVVTNKAHMMGGLAVAGFEGLDIFQPVERFTKTVAPKTK